MEPQVLISKYQIEPYRGSAEKLRQLAVAFVGAPRSSGTPGRVLLQNDPGGQQAMFYEFRASDILYVEEASSLSLPDGSTASMVRLWVRKGVKALRMEAFQVQDMAEDIRDMFGF